MKFQARVPRVFTSTVSTGSESSQPVLDGRDVVVSNRWKLPPYTVALVGRPAVWTGLDLTLPELHLGPVDVPSRRLRWEQDFGGHLYLAITDADTAKVTIVEGGPSNANGSGNLVPFDYPEDDFAERGVIDFEPVVIEPPHGMSKEFFAQLVRDAHKAYDGDQRYLAIEIPFFRVGRDSNSYAVGVLLCCGVDPRAIPKPSNEMRWELTGYPGAEDPVHHANFGTYLGAPTDLGDGAVDVGYHNADGSVRYAVVGGTPNGNATLPDFTIVQLDEHGRIAFSPEDAKKHGLPSQHTEPPQQIVQRRQFPTDPAPQGAQITLVVGGESVPLVPGTEYAGTVVNRHDALGLATLRRDDGLEIVLPLTELGVELRDPKRVDELMRVGTDITVGLHRDRHPRLVAHGERGFQDRLTWRRFHAPRPVNIAGTVAGGVALIAVAGVFVWRSRR